MTLITLDIVKSKFPLWNSYCQTDNELTAIVNDSETIMLEYIKVTSETMTPQLILHLINIIRKRCFDTKHGDTEFESEPQILKDYKETMKLLLGYREGTTSIQPADLVVPANLVSITSKPRRFGGKWFSDDYVGDYNG